MRRHLDLNCIGGHARGCSRPRFSLEPASHRCRLGLGNCFRPCWLVWLSVRCCWSPISHDPITTHYDYSSPDRRVRGRRCSVEFVFSIIPPVDELGRCARLDHCEGNTLLRQRRFPCLYPIRDCLSAGFSWLSSAQGKQGRGRGLLGCFAISDNVGPIKHNRDTRVHVKLGTDGTYPTVLSN